MLLPEKATSVAVVNKQQILLISQNGEDYVPVRPICDALGIDSYAQIRRIQRDEILAPTAATMAAVGADEKSREMVAIPLRYVFGWLFTIETNLVKEEVRPAVIAYKKECYDALYDHFKSYADYVEFRMRKIEEAENIVSATRLEFNTAKDKIKEANEIKAKAYGFSYQDWLEGKRQLAIDFKDEEPKAGAS